MIVEHHRSTYRFASKRWRGPKRLLLVPTAAALAVRAALSVLFTVASVWDRTFIPDRLRLTTSPETTRPSVVSTVAGQAAAALGKDRRSWPLTRAS